MPFNVELKKVVDLVNILTLFENLLLIEPTFILLLIITSSILIVARNIRFPRTLLRIKRIFEILAIFELAVLMTIFLKRRLVL